MFRRGESGYPFQVDALPPSGCVLSNFIPHANGKTRKLIFKKISQFGFSQKPRNLAKALTTQFYSSS